MLQVKAGEVITLTEGSPLGPEDTGESIVFNLEFDKPITSFQFAGNGLNLSVGMSKIYTSLGPIDGNGNTTATTFPEQSGANGSGVVLPVPAKFIQLSLTTASTGPDGGGYSLWVLGY